MRRRPAAVTFALLLASVATAEEQAATEQSRCFYCGKWNMLSRAFYGAPDLEISEKTITWGYCGPRPIPYSIITRTSDELIVRLRPKRPCKMFGQPITHIKFEPYTSVSGHTGDLAVTLFDSEKSFRTNAYNTWGVYVR